MNSEKKILFTDLDATLLTDDKKVGPATKQALKDLLAAGHYLCFCSGRPVASVIDVATELGYGMGSKNVYYVGSNGGVCIESETEKEIYAFRMKKEAIDIIQDGADKFGVHVHTYTRTHIVSRAQTKELDSYQTIIHMPTLLVQNLSDVEEPPYKCLCIKWYDHETLVKLKEYLDSNSKGMFKSLFSNEALLEVIPPISGKHVAVEKLSEYLNVEIKNTFACGDENNDASMIERAGLGVAMINGTESPKAVADVITKQDNNNDGLVPYIKEFFLL